MPGSGYMLFANDKRSTLPPGLKVTEQGKQLGALWGKLSDAEKSKYKEKAKTAPAKPKAAKKK